MKTSARYEVQLVLVIPAGSFPACLDLAVTWVASAQKAAGFKLLQAASNLTAADMNSCIQQNMAARLGAAVLANFKRSTIGIHPLQIG